MNRQRIKGLIEHIEKIPASRFAMDEYVNGVLDKKEQLGLAPACGTSACIAGWTHCIWGDHSITSGTNIHEEARKLLGLTNKEANDLFLGYKPDGDQISLSGITNKQAVNTLKRLLQTNKIRWDERNDEV